MLGLIIALDGAGIGLVLYAILRQLERIADKLEEE